MQLYTNDKSDKELPSVAFFFFLSLWKVRILAKSATIRAGKPTGITTLGAYLD
jgi:hypothetical protein